MSWRHFLAIACMAAGVGAAAAGGARAQDYPNQPVRMILGYAPGGVVDFTGRVLAQALGKTLGQQLIVENKPGASGAVAATFLAKAKPDGYTIMLMDIGTVINPHMRKDIGYKMSDFSSFGMVASAPVVIVVTNSLPVKTPQELIAYGKANPDKLSYASAGVGTAPHLGAEQLFAHVGVKAVHVPYQGIGQSFPDLISGKIQVAFSSVAGAIPFISDNRIRAIATTGAKRPAVLKDHPTVAETLMPGYNVDIWLTLGGPKGIPAAVAAKLNSSLAQAQKDPDFLAGLAKIGAEAWSTSVKEANDFLAAEDKHWGPIVKAAGLANQ
jgi:tripartite-type tricarboxylate transporter receptor subunit TctC